MRAALPAPVPDWLTIQTSTETSRAAWRRRGKTAIACRRKPLSSTTTSLDTRRTYEHRQLLSRACLGTYSLPLVYGNAIKDGATNAAAYTFDGQRDEHPESLFNHSWVQFHQSLIFPIHGITLTDAKLLWQDVNGMIEESSVQLQRESPRVPVTDKIGLRQCRTGGLRRQYYRLSWHI